MSQVITATVENGMLRPDEQLDLPSGTRVRVVLEPLENGREAAQQAWRELERLRQEAPIHSGGVRLTRDQLHERR